MRLTSLLVWKSWASNKLRTALTILGIAVGVAVVTAIHVMDHNTIQSQLRLQRPDFGRVDFELVPKDRRADPFAVRAALEGREDLADVGLFHRAAITTPSRDGAATEFLELLGLSPRPSQAFSHYVLAAGRDPTDLDGDAAVLVPEALAERMGWQVGSTFAIQPPAVPPRALCLGGKLVQGGGDAVGTERERPGPVTVEVVGLLTSHGLARARSGNVVIGSFALARRFAPGGHTMFQVNRAYGADADRLRRQLAPDFQVLDENSALLGEAADERAFRNGVKVLGGLALVLGMFVVFQTLSQLLVERLRQVGLLRCLGASRGAIAWVFFVDALAMAVLGVLLGSGLGVGLAWLLQSMRFTTLGVGKVVSSFELPVVPMVWIATLGLVFTLLGAVFPLYKARNLPALAVVNARSLEAERGGDVLRGVHVFLFVLLVFVLPGAYLAMTPILGESEGETRAVLVQLLALVVAFGAILLLAPRILGLVSTVVLWPLRPLAPLATFLVRSSLSHAGGRYAASVCGLAVVLLAIVAVSSITGALRGEILAFGDLTTQGRVFVGAAGPVPVATARALERVEGVARVEVHEGTRQVPYLLSGLAVDELVRPGAPLEHAPDLARAYAEERGLVISRRLANFHRVGPGDDLGVLTDEGRKAYTVLAVSDAAGFWIEERAWAVTAPRWMQRDFCVGDACVTAATLHLREDASPVAVRARIKGAVPAFSRIRIGEEIVRYHLRDLTRDFLLFDVLLGLILVLALVGLVNQMTIAAMSRTREFGVLRALGMSTGQLRQAFWIESMLVAVLAAGLAVALGLPVGWLVVRGLGTVTGLQAPFVPPWKALGVVVLLALGVGVLAAILPGLRAARVSPARSVRYE